MIKVKVLTSLCVFFMSSMAFADCPNSLNAEKMAECITVEGSGANYQDWKKNEYEHNLASDSEIASTTVSPITGTDIRTLQPAAGGKRNK